MKRVHTLLLISLLFSISCGGSRKRLNNPVLDLQQSLAASKEYSIILEDMKTEGNFVDEYFHKYKVITVQEVTGQEDVVFDERTTDWYQVDKRLYENYKGALGMVIASKDENGKVNSAAQPPGYQYVGNTRYGQWRTQSDGSRFWEFYGKYALMSSVFNMVAGPVYYRDYDRYRSYYRNNQPYYGSSNQWGTNGTYTKKTHPTFYQRRQQRAAASKNRFSNKVRNRTSRSNMSSTRSRSGGSRGGK